jgi:hypothetical protein
MRNLGPIAVVIICCAAILLVSNTQRSGALERAQRLEDSIPFVEAQRDSAQQRADSVTSEAVRLDSVVVAVRDSTASEVVRLERQVRIARSAFANRGDSIRVLVTDTTALALLDEQDSLFTVALAQKDSIVRVRDRTIVALDSARVFWRTAKFTQDTVIMGWEQTDSLRVAINDALRDHIRGQERRKWAERAVGALGVLCGFFCG